LAAIAASTALPPRSNAIIAACDASWSALATIADVPRVDPPGAPAVVIGPDARPRSTLSG
jgi:hypothetical protein